MNGLVRITKIRNTDSDETEYDPDRQRLVSASQEAAVAWSSALLIDLEDLLAPRTDKEAQRRNMKRPQFLHPDPLDDSALYLTGRYLGKGAVYKFNKDSTPMWLTLFDNVTNINAYAHDPNG